jgi:hypothetical protein
MLPSGKTWPPTADALQTASSVTAQGALLANAQAARDSRKSVKVRELRTAMREAAVTRRSQFRTKDSMIGVLADKGVRQVAGKGLTKAVGLANPIGLATASVMSATAGFTAAKNAGASNTQAAGAAAVAASPTAAGVAAPSLIAKFAPRVASTVAKAAPWMMLASAAFAAGREGYNAYAAGQGAGGILKAGALGAADSATFGLASAAYQKLTGDKTLAKAPSPTTGSPANGGDPTTLAIAQAAGHTPGDGEGNDQISEGNMAKKPMIQDPTLLRDDKGGTALPNQRKVEKNLGDASLAQVGTRYQRALIKGAQNGDIAASVLADANRKRMDERSLMRSARKVQAGPNSKAATALSNVRAKRAESDAADAKKGADGISEAARRTGANIDAQREAWESMLRGNPDLARQLGPEGSKFKPQSPADIQRAFDAIHSGSGGRSDGRGQVDWSKPGKTPAPGGPGRQGSLSEAQSRQFSAANQQYEQHHMAAAPAEDLQGPGERGWANPKVQNAAQEARGVKNKTSWAKG